MYTIFIILEQFIDQNILLYIQNEAKYTKIKKKLNNGLNISLYARPQQASIKN